MKYIILLAVMLCLSPLSFAQHRDNKDEGRRHSTTVSKPEPRRDSTVRTERRERPSPTQQPKVERRDNPSRPNTQVNTERPRVRPERPIQRPNDRPSDRWVQRPRPRRDEPRTSRFRYEYHVGDRRWFPSGRAHYGHYREYGPRVTWHTPYYYYGPRFPNFLDSSVVIIVPGVINYTTVFVDYPLYSAETAIPEGVEQFDRDITQVFLTKDADLLTNLVDPNTPISIIDKGNYAYSLSPEDFISITKDALDNRKTTGFYVTAKHIKQLNKVYQLYACHTYINDDGREKTTRIRITIKEIKGYWSIIQMEIP